MKKYTKIMFLVVLFATQKLSCMNGSASSEALALAESKKIEEEILLILNHCKHNNVDSGKISQRFTSYSGFWTATGWQDYSMAVISHNPPLLYTAFPTKSKALIKEQFLLWLDTSKNDLCWQNLVMKTDKLH